MPVLAYHIVWTTYGTWLPGDGRGWVKKSVPGIQAPRPLRERLSQERMAEDKVILTSSQRELIGQTIRDHCRLRQWLLHAVNIRSNHIHIVVTGDRDPDEVMKQFKAWCSRKLSDAAGDQQAVAAKAGRRRWFTEGGDKEIIEDEIYLENAIRYVLEGQ